MHIHAVYGTEYIDSECVISVYIQSSCMVT